MCIEYDNFLSDIYNIFSFEFLNDRITTHYTIIGKMKTHRTTAAILLILFLISGSCNYSTKSTPSKEEILSAMNTANEYFMDKWPDTGKEVLQAPTGILWKSNIWTRGTYYTGLMSLYRTTEDPRLLKYAMDWGESHEWQISPKEMWNDHLAGQTYIELYLMDTTKHELIMAVKESIDAFIQTGDTMGRAFGADWNWIDAAFMAMPLFAQLGALTGEDVYYEQMHSLFTNMKDNIGGGLYNEEDGLWWRDASFVAPYQEPNGEDCYWSRGNGWIVGALVRTLEVIPENAPNRNEYLNILKQMCEALLKVQREDGMWNVSLHDPGHFGGKEVTGTSFFLYGMAWAVNNGLLDAEKFSPAIYHGWNTMVNDCLHPNGFLGFVQGTGKEPKDQQPVSYASMPDFEDYGLGAFLLAGCEIYNMK